MQEATLANGPQVVSPERVELPRVEEGCRLVGFQQQSSVGPEAELEGNALPVCADRTAPQLFGVENQTNLGDSQGDAAAATVECAASLGASGGGSVPTAASSAQGDSLVKGENHAGAARRGDKSVDRARNAATFEARSEVERCQASSDPLDFASLFLSPLDDLDSWGGPSNELPLPASSFVVTEAISPAEGQSSFGGVATFLFSLFQGDVRLGILSAQGRLMAWRSLLFLADQHDRRLSAALPNGSTQSAIAESAAAVRRRRLQRESLATSRSKRSVRHAFLLDRGTANSAAASSGPVVAGPAVSAVSVGPSGAGVSGRGGVGLCCACSRGGLDECDEEDAHSGLGGNREEGVANDAAVSVEALAASAARGGLEAGGLAPLLQRNKLFTHVSDGLFPRFVGGTIDRRWAMQHKAVKVAYSASLEKSNAAAFEAAGTATGDAAIQSAPLSLLMEEFPLQPAIKMWPHACLLPEKIFVGLPIQVACWVCCGRAQGGESSGRMLWRDCEVDSEVSNGLFFAVPRSAGEGRESVQRLQIRVAAFAPPRLPTPSPAEGCWRLAPLPVDVCRDIYPGACLSVGLLVNAPSSQSAEEAGGSQGGGSRCFFVDVVVQRIFFSVEEANRAKASGALATESSRLCRSVKEDGNEGVLHRATKSRTGEASASDGLWGLRPNVPVKAMRVMVLRSGGAEQEFANVDGRKIYKLGFDLLPKSPNSQQRFSWAVPRALCPCALSRLSASTRRSERGAVAESRNVVCLSVGELESASRWNFPTAEGGEEWKEFPPFVVAFLPYDQRAVYARSHPALLAYLTPELDFAAVSRGQWRLRLPQCLPLRSAPCVVPHPSDFEAREEAAPAAASSEKNRSAGAEAGAVFFASAHAVSSPPVPVARSPNAGAPPGGSGPRSGSASLAQGLVERRDAEPPLPVAAAVDAVGEAQGGDGAGGAPSVLAMNHLANLLCSTGASTEQVLSKALPFFRFLLSSQQQTAKWGGGGNATAGDATAVAAAAAVKAANKRASSFFDDDAQDGLWAQSLSFSSTVPSASRVAEGEDFRRRLESCQDTASTVWAEERSSGSAALEAAPGRCAPTTKHISSFLLSTSGYKAPSAAGPGGEVSAAGGVGFAPSRRGRLPAAADGGVRGSGETACDAFEISDDEASTTTRRAGTAFSGSAEPEKTFYPILQGRKGISNFQDEHQPVLSGGSAAATPPVAAAESVRGSVSPLHFKEETRQLLASRGKAFSTACGGVARRTRQGPSFGEGENGGFSFRRGVKASALGAADEPDATGVSGCLPARPAKKAMRGVTPACDQVDVAWDLVALQRRRQLLQQGEDGLEPPVAERSFGGKSSPPLEGAPGVVGDTWRGEALHREEGCSRSGGPGEQVFATEKLHEALKGFLQSIRGGGASASTLLPLAAASTSRPLSRNKGFAA